METPAIPELSISMEFKMGMYVRESVDENDGWFCRGIRGGLVDVVIVKAVYRGM